MESPIKIYCLTTMTVQPKKTQKLFFNFYVHTSNLIKFHLISSGRVYHKPVLLITNDKQGQSTQTSPLFCDYFDCNWTTCTFYSLEFSLLQKRWVLVAYF